MLSRTQGSRTRTRSCKLVLEDKDKDFPQGQQHCVTVKKGLLADIYQYLTSVSNPFFTVSLCNRIYGLHVVIIHNDCLQNAKSLTIFEDFVVQGQGLMVRGQGQLTCKLVFEDPRGQGLSSRTTTLLNISKVFFFLYRSNARKKILSRPLNS